MAATIRSVFLSYARQDAVEFSKRLATDLRMRGHQVFLDLTDIEKGGLWDVRLEQGISDADVMAAVMTPGSLREDSVCRDEVVFAINQGKTVIPLKLYSSPSLKPTLLLARRNWVDFSADYETGLQSLLRHFAGEPFALRPPPLHTVTGVVPLDFGPEIARLTADFTGRAWLDHELERWLNDSRGRAFVIIGEPGIGKSAIAAWLSVVRQNQTISIHFCTDRNSRTLQPFEFVASLVGQLSTQVPGFTALVALKHPEVRRPSANDAFRELVVEPAQNLTPPNSPLIVVVDSLDEAIRVAGETLLDVLVNQADDLPSWLRIVATTRPDEQVLRRIRRLQTFELRPDVAENIFDITLYTDNRLAKLRAAERLSEQSARLVADRLPELANGNFLYARMALDALEYGTLSADDLRFLSPGMSDFYEKSFSRLFSDDKAFEVDAQPILRALSVAMEPVPFVIIDRASRRRKETLEDTHRRLLQLRSYLHITGKGLEGTKYALFHKSLGDWLTDPDGSGFYWCSPERGKEQLAEACWQDYENDPEKMTEYALRYGMFHLRDVRRDADARKLSQDETLRQRRIQLGLSGLFLSYAQGDDEAFVAKLHDDLTTQGFDVWLDREALARDQRLFSSEERRSLDEYDRLVLVVGPNALKSKSVEAEWRYALANGKTVAPVLRIGEYAELPEELRQSHVVDARDDASYVTALAEFVRLVGEPPPFLGRLFGVPSLPPSFVAYPRLIRELKDFVLGASSEVSAVSSGAVTVSSALVGMGGIGKTVLLIAFARDQEVRRAFPDGIFWLTIGEQPNLVERQKQLLYFLGPLAHSLDINTEEEGHAMLNYRLADKQALILLDDVWDTRHAGAFTALGRQCRTVITTRNAGAARTLGGRVLMIDVPSEGDAAAILAQSAGSSVDALSPAAFELLSMLGHHPLAMAIAGGMVRHGASWIEVRDKLRERSWELADPPATDQHGSIMSVIKLSYEALPEYEQKRLVELASAFSADSYMTIHEVAQVWAKVAGVSERDAGKVLDVLNDRGWIQVRLEQGSPEKQRVTLHPLIRQFLREISR